MQRMLLKREYIRVVMCRGPRATRAMKVAVPVIDHRQQREAGCDRRWLRFPCDVARLRGYAILSPSVARLPFFADPQEPVAVTSTLRELMHLLLTPLGWPRIDVPSSFRSVAGSIHP